MSTARTDFFVYLTTTYARSKKREPVLARILFYSGTCTQKLEKAQISAALFSDFIPEKAVRSIFPAREK
jgi:hypothetical protein